MKESTLIRFAGTPEAAHLAAKEAYVQAKTLIALGQRVKLTVEEAEDEKSVKQRGFLHKAVLTQVSEQARGEDGQRYAMPVWKELFRAQFLGSKWTPHPQGAKFPPLEIRVSTEDLGLKAYSDYIDQVIAEAVTTWGVAFRFIAEEREAVRYVAPVRKAKKQPEAVAA